MSFFVCLLTWAEGVENNCLSQKEMLLLSKCTRVNKRYSINAETKEEVNAGHLMFLYSCSDGCFKFCMNFHSEREIFQLNADFTLTFEQRKRRVTRPGHEFASWPSLYFMRLHAAQCRLHLPQSARWWPDGLAPSGRQMVRVSPAVSTLPRIIALQRVVNT